MSNKFIGILYTIAVVILVIIGLKVLSKVVAVGIFLLFLAAAAAVMAVIYYRRKDDKKSKRG